MDSGNPQAPTLGPGLPSYPQLRQMLRTVQQEGRVWQGFTQQWDGSGKLRDREAAYLWEANSIQLASGVFYRARLIGNYCGAAGCLPLYFIGLACCAGVSSSSLSSGCVLNRTICVTFSCKLRKQICVTLTQVA